MRMAAIRSMTTEDNMGQIKDALEVLGLTAPSQKKWQRGRPQLEKMTEDGLERLLYELLSQQDTAMSDDDTDLIQDLNGDIQEVGTELDARRGIKESTDPLVALGLAAPAVKESKTKETVEFYERKAAQLRAAIADREKLLTASADLDEDEKSEFLDEIDDLQDELDDVSTIIAQYYSNDQNYKERRTKDAAYTSSLASAIQKQRELVQYCQEKFEEAEQELRDVPQSELHSPTTAVIVEEVNRSGRELTRAQRDLADMEREWNMLTKEAAGLTATAIKELVGGLAQKGFYGEQVQKKIADAQRKIGLAEEKIHEIERSMREISNRDRPNEYALEELDASRLGYEMMIRDLEEEIAELKYQSSSGAEDWQNP